MSNQMFDKWFDHLDGLSLALVFPDIWTDCQSEGVDASDFMDRCDDAWDSMIPKEKAGIFEQFKNLL